MTSTPIPGDVSARARGILEEELCEFRPLADLPASEIEAMAARRTRALAPMLAGHSDVEAPRSAA
ncbi:MAG: hypothetical protein H0T41_10180 [Rhodobacteraceae bacterium]|nr:hypothetical protein [Paracoccaceae bacterium]